MDLRTLDGLPIPQHDCSVRSDIARRFAVVFSQPEKVGSRYHWHHQIVIGNSQPVAIRHCPFCGVSLDIRIHFGEVTLS